MLNNYDKSGQRFLCPETQKGGVMPKKRGQNEGSIYIRKDGRIIGAVSIQGKRIEKSFKTKTDAREWLKQTISQIDSGLNFQGAQYITSDYLQDWLVTKKNHIRPNTLKQYEQVIKQHIDPVIGSIKLRDLTPIMLQKFYNRKLENGTSENTVALIHRVLRCALRQAYMMGLIVRNPLISIRCPKPTRKEMKILNEAQVRNLLLASKGTNLEALLHLAVTTGLRMGEIIGLKWEDLEMNSATLKVQRQVQREKGRGLVFSQPKSLKSRRVIILGSTTVEKLKQHFHQQDWSRLIAGERWEENNLIFPNTVGRPMEHSRLLKEYKEILGMAGLPIIRFHDLRHTAATLMLQAGIHPKIVQETLGHADISLTMNTYSHALPTLQREAAEKMDELVTLIDVNNLEGSIVERKQ